jgi:hypothetical protein
MYEENKWLFACLALVIAAYAIFYPLFYASGDEYSYVRTANLILHGTFFEKDLFSAMGSVESSNGFVPNVSMNYPFFLAPFLLFGFSAVFLSGFLFHIVNIVIFSRILKKAKLSQKYVFLYAFFPALFWLSRTLYPQTLAATFLLLGFLFYLYFLDLNENKRENRFEVRNILLQFNKSNLFFCISGIFFGFGVFIRPDLIIAVGLFSLVMLFKHGRKVLFFIFGGLFPALVLLLNNSIQYGSIGATSYGSGGAGMVLNAFLGISFVDVAIIVAALSIFYPLMIPSLFLNKSKLFFEIIALAIGQLIIQVSYAKLLAYALNPFSFYFVNLRYLSPVIPFFIFSFVLFFENTMVPKINIYLKKNKFLAEYEAVAFRKKFARGTDFSGIGFVLFVVFLVCVCFAFSFVHNSYLNDRHEVLNQIYSVTPQDALLIGSSDDKMFFIKGVLSNRQYLRFDMWNDVAGFQVGQTAEGYFNDKTYLVQLEYSNRRGRETIRQNVINKEREILNNFIESNEDHLQLVFDVTSPHDLRIYKWVG